MNHLVPFAERDLGNIPATYPDGHHPQEDAQWIGLADVLRSVLVHRRAVLAIAGAVVALAVIVALIMPSMYQGSALVMVDEQQSHVVDDPSVLSGLPSDPSSIASQVEILKSRALAGRAVDSLGLVDDPEFNGDDSGTSLSPIFWIGRVLSYLRPAAPAASGLSSVQQRREFVIDKLLARTSVSSVGHSTLIEIDVLSRSAVKAATIANGVAETYVRDLADTKIDATRGASKWLTDRVQQLAAQAGEADAAVQQYKADNGLMDTSAGTSIIDQQLGDLTSQVILAETAQADAQAKLSRVRELVHSGHGADVSQVVDSPLIGQLRQQEAALVQSKAELSSHYGPLHPKMLDIEAQIKVLNAKIGDETNRVIGTVANDVAVASAHVGALRGNMATLKSQANSQNQARVKLGELQANATSIHSLYQTYLERLKQTQQQASLNVPDVRVASPASVPLSPAYPKRGLIVAAAVPSGLFLGLIFALMADRFQGGFRSAEELEAGLGVGVSTTMPELPRRGRTKKAPGLEVLAKPLSQYSESVRTILMELSLFQRRSGQGKVVVVTSAIPDEGKTTLVTSLARQAALSGYKTIVVDGDMRRSGIIASFGLTDVRYSLADFLEHNCNLDEAFVPDPHSTVMTLASRHTSNAPDLVGSDDMKAAIGRLRAVADLVIIDCPPVLAVNDAKVLAQFANHIVVAVRWEKTSRDTVRKAFGALRSLGIGCTAVLTRADMRRLNYYNYGYKGASSLTRYYQT